MKMTSIGQHIRQYRLERNIRQEDLAEKTGLSVNYVGMVERGEKIPALETFITILLSKAEQNKIYEVIDTLIKHSNK